MCVLSMYHYVLRDSRRKRISKQRDCEIREIDGTIFRMSMNIGKSVLRSIARELHEGPTDFDEAVRRCHDGFAKKIADRLLKDLKEEYPDRDFTGGKISKARGNIAGKIKTALKCKLI